MQRVTMRADYSTTRWQTESESPGPRGGRNLERRVDDSLGEFRVLEFHLLLQALRFDWPMFSALSVFIERRRRSWAP